MALSNASSGFSLRRLRPPEARPVGEVPAVRQMPEVQQVFDAKWVRIIDADTLVVRLDKFHGDQSTKTLRLLGVDAPELRTEAGKAARDFAEDFLIDDLLGNHDLVIQTTKFDSFGRVLAYVWRKDDGASLGDALREAGHARAVSELAQLKAAREG